MLGDAPKAAKPGGLTVSVAAASADVGSWLGRIAGGDGVLGVLLISVMNVLSCK